MILMKRPALILAPLTLAAFLTGCALRLPRWHHVTKPSAQVTSVRLDDQSEQGARVIITVALSNPNDLSLPLIRSAYTVKLGDLPAATFHEDPLKALPRTGPQTVELAAAVPTNGASVAGMDYRVSGSITYEPPGEVRQVLTESGVPLPTVGFSSSGSLSQ
jgi:hypothetical protein